MFPMNCGRVHSQMVFITTVEKRIKLTNKVV